MLDHVWTDRLTRRISLVLVGVACLLAVATFLLPPGTAALATASGDTDQNPIIRPGEGESPLHTALNEILSLQESELVSLDLPAHAGEPFTVQTTVSGQVVTLDLWPHSVRAAEYRVVAQIEGGEFVELDPGPINTLRGVAVEWPGSQIAASLWDKGFSAFILLPDGSSVWIEPVLVHVPDAADPTLHVVYSTDALIGSPGDCGLGGPIVPQRAVLNGASGSNAGADTANASAGDGGDSDGSLPNQGGVAGSAVLCAKLGVDADYAFYQASNNSTTSVTNQVNQIVNTSNLQYENEIGVKHDITQIIIRTSENDNPYTTNHAGSLLNQFQSAWNTQPEWSIPRAVAHLWTGQNLQGSTIGIAKLNTTCSKSNAYSLSQRLTWSLAWKTDLFAHELGHNWSATHCSCPQHTMNPSITGTNTFHSSSITQITNKKNNVGCLSTCVPPGPQPPPNNTCQSSAIVSEGMTPFTTVLASTTGPSEFEKCGFDSMIESDIWFRHTAQCTGELTVSLCGSPSGFDSKIAVYGVVCPMEPDMALACNKDSCGQLSEVTLAVVEGQTVRIRVGGHNGAQGEGILSISCNPDVSEPTPCLADLTGDGVVDIFDLLDVLAAWGECDGCSEDITGDGVVDIFDLLEVLAAWGPCED